MSKPLKVMIVDDSNTVHRTAEIILKKEGYEVIGFKDGFDALANVMEVNPDLIFMDVMMPNLDGYDTCQIIKSSPHECSKIPVIMLTNRDGAFDKARGDLAGCDGFITKPFSREELIDALEAHAS